MFRCTTFHIAGLAALLASSCQAPPKPLALPSATLSVDYERSTLATAENAPDAARLVELYAVSGAPTGTPVALAASAIVSDRGTPFRGKTQLPIGSRWLGPSDVQAVLDGLHLQQPWQVQKLGATSAVLHGQLVTSVFVGPALVGPGFPDPSSPNPSSADPSSADPSSMADPTKTTDSATSQPSVLPTLRLQHSPSGLRATLSTDPSTEPAALPLANSPDSDPPEREVVVLSGAIADTEAVGLFVPDPRVPGGGLLLLALPTDAPSSEAVATAIETANNKLAGNREAPPQPMSWRVAQRAVGERNRRPALLAVTTQLELPRITDLILASDEPLLIAMCKQLELVDGTADRLAWPVEASLWQALIPRMERDELTPSLRAAAIRHLGALADDASTLALLLATSRDDASFAKALVDENLAALADRSAAIRVTAVRWLQGKQIEVDGYDAMGSKAERRRAVRRYLTALEDAVQAKQEAAAQGKLEAQR